MIGALFTVKRDPSRLEALATAAGQGGVTIPVKVPREVLEAATGIAQRTGVTLGAALAGILLAGHFDYKRFQVYGDTP